MFQLHFRLFTLDELRNGIADRFEFGLHPVRDRPRRKHRRYTHHAVRNQQWIASESGYSFPAGPFVVAGIGIVKDIVGQVRLPALCDAPNFTLPHLHASVSAVQMSGFARAAFQFQNLFGLVHRPDVEKRRIQMLCQSFAALLQNHLRRCVPGQDSAHRDAHLQKPRALGRRVLGFYALRHVAEHQHDAGDLSAGIANGRGAIVNRYFPSVFCS